jgi:anti-sigma regulatory factor (Ser/Thr protein kinase)
VSSAVLRLRVPPDTSALAGHMERVRAFLSDHNINHHLSYDIPLCVHECCANAILHSGSRADIDVVLSLDENSVTILVADSGRGLDLRGCDPFGRPELLSSCGRGLFLMTHLMDEFEMDSDHGTQIRMTKRLPGRAA